MYRSPLINPDFDLILEDTTYCQDRTIVGIGVLDAVAGVCRINDHAATCIDSYVTGIANDVARLHLSSAYCVTYTPVRT